MATLSFKKKLLSLQGNLLSFAYSLTANRDDAYDLMQDTTLKALDNEDKYLENVNFKGWVFTIMRNIFINNYRASVRANVVIDRSNDLYQLNLGQESAGGTPEDSATLHEIHKALRHLPEDYRVPFTLFLQGYKYKEIALRYNMPLGTVKSRIYIARQRLQDELKDLRYD